MEKTKYKQRKQNQFTRSV